MASELASAMDGARARYYRKVFLGAAIWNVLAACAVLFFPTNAKFWQETGFPGAPDTISLQLLASCLLVFGLGYYWVSCDLSRNRDLVRMGVIAKPIVFLVFLGHAVAGEIPIRLVFPSVVDLLFGVLFLEFLVRTREKVQ